MGENLDADPDLSKDTKLKKLFRDTTDWMFDTSKPVAKYDKPWYHPGRLFDSQCGEDPIKTPNNDSHLERNYALVYHKPMFNVPIQDPFAQPLMRQHNKCGDLELKCLECIEYYGAHRGTIICQDYYDDWKECAAKNLSRLRNRAMDMQYRKKYWQYWRGERPYPFANIPQPQGFHEPLRTLRNDYSDGHNG